MSSPMSETHRTMHPPRNSDPSPPGEVHLPQQTIHKNQIQQDYKYSVIAPQTTMSTIEKIPRRLSLRLFRGQTQSSLKPKKTVSFDFENNMVYAYEPPQGEEAKLYYPDMTERETLMEYRRSIMSGYMRGSAMFKNSVEKLYAGARHNYDTSELSSGEFSIESVPDEEFVHKMAASEIRGLEELYCAVIADHRHWAVKRVVQSQREKKNHTGYILCAAEWSKGLFVLPMRSELLFNVRLSVRALKLFPSVCN